MPAEREPAVVRRRLLAVFLIAIGVPGVVLSYGALHAVRSDAYVLSKLREERLGAAAREVVEVVEAEVRDRARAALAFAGPAEAERGRDLEARLEAARTRNPLVREYFALDEHGRLLVPAGVDGGGATSTSTGTSTAPETSLERIERRQGLERRLATARQLELARSDLAAARAAYLEVASDTEFPELAARARLDLARCAAKLGDVDAALEDLDVLGRVGPEIRTDGGVAVAATARLRAGELRIASGRAEEGAARLLELAGDLVEGRLELPEADARAFVANAREAVERALPELAAPAYREALGRLQRAEARLAGTRAYGRELARLLPDIRAILEGGGRPDDVLLVSVGGESPRLLALRAHAGGPVILGAELDLRGVIADVIEPCLRRVASERAVALAVLDRRGRPVATTAEGAAAPPREVPQATEGFETLLPFWRVRATASSAASEALAARFRLLLQVGMIGVLFLAMGMGALFTLRAIDRSLELARMKSEFVSQVSHELRTPLTSIRMFAELLRTGRARTPEKTQEYLGLIEVESTRLQKLIDDILDFARHDAGRKEYRFEPGDAGEVAEEALEAVRAQLAEGGFKVDLDVRRPLPRVRIDRASLRAALENLISNARKYAGERRELRVGVGPADGAGAGGVVIEVADSGVGIDDDELPRIFEKFFRGKDAALMNVPGSGLGLALVKRVVDDHGGTIEVKSKKGEGTTFQIVLPAGSSSYDMI